MTVGIYCIEHFWSQKKYIGKSTDIQARFRAHIHNLTNDHRASHCNRHLLSAVRKFGIDEFEFYYLEVFDEVDEVNLSEAELKWMDHFKTFDRKYGYNLRRDSSTRVIVSQETKSLLSKRAVERTSGQKGIITSQRMRDAVASLSEEDRLIIKEKSSEKVRKFDFVQCDKSGNPLRIWPGLSSLERAYSGFECSNLYKVTSGQRPSYGGYVWKAIPKGSGDAALYDERILPPMDFTKKHRNRPYELLMLSKCGQILKRFDSVKDSVDELGVSEGFIWRCAKGKTSLPNKRVPHLGDVILKLELKQMYRLQEQRIANK